MSWCRLFGAFFRVAARRAIDQPVDAGLLDFGVERTPVIGHQRNAVDQHVVGLPAIRSFPSNSRWARLTARLVDLVFTTTRSASAGASLSGFTSMV